jgi:hypothetical protein
MLAIQNGHRDTALQLAPLMEGEAISLCAKVSCECVFVWLFASITTRCSIILCFYCNVCVVNFWYDAVENQTSL